MLLGRSVSPSPLSSCLSSCQALLLSSHAWPCLLWRYPPSLNPSYAEHSTPSVRSSLYCMYMCTPGTDCPALLSHGPPWSVPTDPSLLSVTLLQPRPQARTRKTTTERAAKPLLLLHAPLPGPPPTPPLSPPFPSDDHHPSSTERRRLAWFLARTTLQGLGQLAEKFPLRAPARHSGQDRRRDENERRRPTAKSLTDAVAVQSDKGFQEQGPQGRRKI
ncbi:hypothetical protein LZ31DRAFT_139923 [Colletotrichum somersetense]|nr:hypothetical protein LZ31DRAFT_139923 [Colletotrichum somersetense]